MKKRINKMAAFLTAVVLTTVCMCQAVFAATAGIDTARQGTLELDLKDAGKKATFSIYRVGEWDGKLGGYVLADAFSAAGVDFDFNTEPEEHYASEVIACAKALADHALDAENGVEALASLETSGGRAKFAGLTNGIYLICQKKGTADNVTASPFLLNFPSLSPEGAWIYEIVSEPKYTVPEKPDKPGGNSPGGSGGGGGGNPPTTTIPPQEVPGAELVPIAPEEVPLAFLPKTGDINAEGVFMAAIALSAAALAFLLIVGRRKSRKEP